MSQNQNWSSKEEEIIKKFDEEIENGSLQKKSFPNSDEAIQWLKQL